MNYLTRAQLQKFNERRGMKMTYLPQHYPRYIIHQLSESVDVGERYKAKFVLTHIPMGYGAPAAEFKYTFHSSATSARLWADTYGQLWVMNDTEDQSLFVLALAAMNPITHQMIMKAVA